MELAPIFIDLNNACIADIEAPIGEQYISSIHLLIYIFLFIHLFIYQEVAPEISAQKLIVPQ